MHGKSLRKCVFRETRLLLGVRKVLDPSSNPHAVSFFSDQLDVSMADSRNSGIDTAPSVVPDVVPAPKSVVSCALEWKVRLGCRVASF